MVKLHIMKFYITCRWKFNMQRYFYFFFSKRLALPYPTSPVIDDTETARRSFIPSSVTHLNSLRANIREADTYLSFRRILLSFMHCESHLYFLKGQRKVFVLYARIRNSCSDLKFDLFQNHLTDDKKCTCGHDNENALHYFFGCNNCTHQRIIMFHQTKNLHPFSLNAVLFGKTSLSEEDNFVLNKAIQQYIKDSRRFEKLSSRR